VEVAAGCSRATAGNPHRGDLRHQRARLLADLFAQLSSARVGDRRAAVRWRQAARQLVGGWWRPPPLAPPPTVGGRRVGVGTWSASTQPCAWSRWCGCAVAALPLAADTLAQAFVPPGEGGGAVRRRRGGRSRSRRPRSSSPAAGCRARGEHGAWRSWAGIPCSRATPRCGPAPGRPARAAQRCRRGSIRRSSSRRAWTSRHRPWGSTTRPPATTHALGRTPARRRQRASALARDGGAVGARCSRTL
jgi:hypothetical protein